MPAHSTTIVPRFGELDPYNHVNHAAYVAYFEAARCVALDEIEMSLADLSERGLQIVVTHLDVKFREPATARDILTVETQIVELKRVSSTWRQRIIRESDGKDLVEAELTLGVCDMSGKPTRPPADLNVSLSRLTENDE
ncbi:MAG: acyl-CoA thioesterase [Actinomycetota bacterium]|nr:acyl-CoA thioesterase [Acidimicrobiales bacterium]MEC8923610.1 acyl-CoA thioesterase [Actinomycetota bacterium]MED5553190.1 acyl-CoA thioesterase [Actinomycetota bacterium]MEE3140604.1 acyl-CoA thioesterase [Actinomycetota bacterium]MEE3187017.1 acyl-CoA thioesterase [Actinomycetota bacterium]|tara:strand:- start:931 stop:1347 length:417 start_codon:yes stop_codon:yes gene_type:complete